MRQTSIVVRKEWDEMAKDRGLLSMIILVPVLLVAAPFLYVFIALTFVGEEILTGGALHQALEALILQYPALAELSAREVFEVLLYKQSVLFLLIIPVMVAISIATYSIIGEKQSRSLEPLLATPVKTWELLLGKSLAAAIPAVLLTWVAFLLYPLGVLALGSASVVGFVMDGLAIFMALVLAPLLIFFNLSLGVVVSSRSSDPRSAQQWSVFIILPILFLILGPIFGLFPLTFNLVLFIALGLAVLDVLVLYFGVRLFQREAILTRWR